MQLYSKIISLVIYVFSFSHTAECQTKKIIEFGWDYPDIDQLTKRLPQMQNTPFDGICFSIQRSIMEAFDPNLHEPDYFKCQQVAKLQWGKYTDNFIILRGYGIKGGQWFDNKKWKIIEKNMQSLSSLMHEGKIEGIFFDPEYYYEDQLYNPWTYDKVKYPNKSFDEVQSQVRKRGYQFITALQTCKKEFSFLSIWITSLIIEELKSLPIEKSRHALLISFFDGMLDGKLKTVDIIDGNEYAYFNLKPSQFLESPKTLQNQTAQLMTRTKSKAEAKEIKLAQPIYYDGLIAPVQALNRDLSSNTKWNWLKENLRFALASSDEYVWFYSEKIDWWKGKINDTLVNILNESKLPIETVNSKVVSTTQKNKINVKSTEAFWYDGSIKSPMKRGSVAFKLVWNSETRSMQINFKSKIPISLKIFVDNKLSKTVTPTSLSITVKLDAAIKGSAVFLALYDDGREAAAFEQYE